MSAFASVLGAACGSPQDAQNLNVLLIAPIIIPLFMIAPVMQQQTKFLDHDGIHCLANPWPYPKG